MSKATFLDGQNLKDALTAGAVQVIGDQDYLNRINVFPVPDGDTGTNLAYTLSTIVQRLRNCADNHAGKVLTLIADAALDGARGNSGAIMAQFFQGLSDSAGNLRRLTTEQFSQAATLGAEYAHDALSEPREGTLITVLRDFAHELSSQVNQHLVSDFVALFQKGLKKAIVSLKNTPNLLDTLKKAGVVDAGAQGFVDLLQGIVAYLSTGEVPDANDAIVIHDSDLPEIAITCDFQFCTECLIQGADIDRRKLRESLAGLGDSLVLAGCKEKVRLHMHVDKPHRLFEIAGEFGMVSGQKADDMQAQTQIHGAHRVQKVALVTDSSADVPDQDMERYSAHVVPLRVHFGDVSHLDKVGITPTEFYAELKKSQFHPTTSQPAPGDFRRLYNYLVSHYEGVVSLHLTGSHSGTYQSAVSAADRTDPEKVRVVDSRSVSVGLGLLVQLAGEMAERGCSIDEIGDALNDRLNKTRVFFVLEDLRFAVRGGRVSPTVQKMADLFRIRPVLTINSKGKVKLGGILFGKSQVVKKFTSFVIGKIRRDKTYRMAVGHAGGEETGQQLYYSLAKQIPILDNSFFGPTGSALGVHAGPGGLVVAIQEID